MGEGKGTSTTKILIWLAVLGRLVVGCAEGACAAHVQTESAHVADADISASTRGGKWTG
jgi:hypothetical protein